MKPFLFIIFLQLSNFVFAENFKIDIGNNETAIINQKNFILLGHSTSAWDTDFSTKDSVRKLIEMREKYNFTTIAMLYPPHLNSHENANQYYFTDDEVDYAIASVGGQHEIFFPNIKNIFIVGGNLTRCLCESVRDIAEGFYDSVDFNIVNMFIVRDGVYDGLPRFNSLTPNSAKDFIEKFFVPAFNCPFQNWSAQRRTQMPNVGMDVYYDKQLIGLYDLEPTDKIEYEMLQKKINVHFIDSSTIEEQMSSLEIDYSLSP